MEKNNINNIKAQISKLVAERDRSGKRKLTNKQRIKHLNEIYDGLLFFWKQCVLTGTAKGSLSIHYQLERARLEMEALGQKAYKAPAKSTLIDSIGFDLPKYDEEKRLH